MRKKKEQKSKKISLRLSLTSSLRIQASPVAPTGAKKRLERRALLAGQVNLRTHKKVHIKIQSRFQIRRGPWERG